MHSCILIAGFASLGERSSHIGPPRCACLALYNQLYNSTYRNRKRDTAAEESCLCTGKTHSHYTFKCKGH